MTDSDQFTEDEIEQIWNRRIVLELEGKDRLFSYLVTKAEQERIVRDAAESDKTGDWIFIHSLNGYDIFVSRSDVQYLRMLEDPVINSEIRDEEMPDEYASEIRVYLRGKDDPITFGIEVTDNPAGAMDIHIGLDDENSFHGFPYTRDEDDEIIMFNRKQVVVFEVPRRLLDIAEDEIKGDT